MKKSLSLVTLSLLLSGCGSLELSSLGGGPKVDVAAADTLVEMSAASGISSTTNFTFKSQAGSVGVSVREAIISVPGSNAAAVRVPLPSKVVPSGIDCPTAANDPTYFCGLQETGSSLKDRTVQYQYNDADLFQKAIDQNPGAKSFSLQFAGTVANASTPWTSNAMTFAIKAENTGGGQTQAPAPVLVINNSESEPYKNILSVSVTSGVAANDTLQKLVLEVTDSRGLLDSTSFVSQAPSAVFNIDTTKYPDGALTLRAVAVAAQGGTGSTSARSVQIRNLVPPTMLIISPTSMQTVSNQLNASVQLSRQNTAFDITGSTGASTVTFNVRDYRGQVVASKEGVFSETNSGLYLANTAFDMNSALFPNNVYTLEAVTRITLSGETTPRTLTQTSQFTTQNSNNRPPALLMHVPTPLGGQVLPRINAMSGAFFQMSDDSGVNQLQLQFTCKSTACKDFGSYSYNYPVNASVATPFVDVGVALDANPFVPDGLYTLRATVTDGSGNTNIQETDVQVDRAATAVGSLARNPVVTVPNLTSGEPNPSSATWSLSGTNTNRVRVVKLVYKKAAATFGYSTPNLISVDTLEPNQSFSDTMGFTEAGDYQISYLIQDLVTGVVRHFPGQVVSVKINK